MQYQPVMGIISSCFKTTLQSGSTTTRITLVANIMSISISSSRKEALHGEVTIIISGKKDTTHCFISNIRKHRTTIPLVIRSLISTQRMQLKIYDSFLRLLQNSQRLATSAILHQNQSSQALPKELSIKCTIYLLSPPILMGRMSIISLSGETDRWMNGQVRITLGKQLNLPTNGTKRELIPSRQKQKIYMEQRATGVPSALLCRQNIHSPFMRSSSTSQRCSPTYSQSYDIL